MQISAITNKKAISNKKKVDNKHAVPAFHGTLANKKAVPDTFVRTCKK